ncbi:hypothetical protein MCOR02_011363 [Pyricularia oryzae]|nr:hypothetical protein MCOR02_011363 [Pyricularia oryzae]
MKVTSFFRGLGMFVGLAVAAPHASNSDQALGLFPREPGVSPAFGLSKRQSCHTPTNRACWSPGFDINTDYEDKIPDTGVTRQYTLTLTEQWNWLGPDGQRKEVAMLINGGYPGPTIRASWGDWIEVTVVNNLEINGTSFHWHGIRMLNNCVNDGANGITECPIAPNKSRKYRFRAQQYGTSWYHSHFSGQYANGVVGHILIDGPASTPYEEDLGILSITDWYYKGADRIQYELIPSPGRAPPSDNILFNGKGISPPGRPAGGSYQRTVLKPGKRHRLRIVNPSVDNVFKVRLAGHPFTVIQTDFVPVQAFTTNELLVGIGQRYDVTIEANQSVGNYWFNVTVTCGGATNALTPASIFQYEGASSTALPTNPGPALDTTCLDIINFSPVVRKDFPEAVFRASSDNTLNTAVTTKNWEGVQRVYWTVNNVDMNITWDEPTLEYVAKGNTNIPQRYNLFRVPRGNEWSVWIINNPIPAPHPMHLHGHDFYVLGRSANMPTATVFDPARDTAGLTWTNPTRRDVTMLPGNGWLAVAFRTDNPGAWLFHCHIAWHVAQGLSVQFLERVDEIPATVNLAELEPTCRDWTAYYETSPNKQHDSGLRTGGNSTARAV